MWEYHLFMTYQLNKDTTYLCTTLFCLLPIKILDIKTLLCIFRDELFEMFPGCSNIELSQRCRDWRIGSCCDHHDVSIASEHVDKCRKLRIPYFHPLKLWLCLRTTQFKLFNDVWYPFKSMSIVLLRAIKTIKKGIIVKEYVVKIEGITTQEQTVSIIYSELKNIYTYFSLETFEMTRNVALSKRTTSSAAQIVLKSFNWVSNNSTLGINE